MTPERNSGGLRGIIGCECSGVVREAFRRMGHDVWSCDLKPAEDGSPFHIKDDVRNVLHLGWDFGIFFPVCKFLANSGSKHLYLGMKKENGRNEQRWRDMEAGADFYLECWHAPIDAVACENPVWHGAAHDYIQKHARIPHPVKRQFVQPWMFGHLETKLTGIAARGLPALVPTNNVRAETMALPYGQRAKVHYASPGPERETERSRTKPGLGDAMAAQYSAFLSLHRKEAA